MCINMAQTTYNALKKTAKVKNVLWFCDNCLIGMCKQDMTSSSLLNKITILEDKIDKQNHSPLYKEVNLTMIKKITE